MTQAPPVTAEQTGEMTHRQVLEALSGLLLAMFVAMLSSTIVSNALPTIVDDLEGSQTGYTWVVVATMLAMTATTPIWGKFADLFDKKLLVQTALVIFSVGSLIAGFAPSMEVLIGARVVQGLGVGGLTALVQVVIATMVSPRERGRYSGYIGAVFALATVSGPLVGGVLVDTVGWRWCFFAGLPVAALAFVVLQKTLRLPVVKRDDVSIDYLGAFLLVGGVSILLIWVSLGGQNFEWLSWTSAVRPPTPSPCTTRAPISTSMLGAKPAMSEPMEKITRALCTSSFLLKRSASLPQIGVVAVMVSRVATTTQV